LSVRCSNKYCSSLTRIHRFTAALKRVELCVLLYTIWMTTPPLCTLFLADKLCLLLCERLCYRATHTPFNTKNFAYYSLCLRVIVCCCIGITVSN
jgi:hypothetical protein